MRNELPSYQEMMNPCLEILSDGKERTIKEVTTEAIKKFKLSEEQQNLETKAGNSLFHSRVYWAVYYMYRANLLERTKRSHYKITKSGIDVLESGQIINDIFLYQYNKDFRDFYYTSRKGKNDAKHAYRDEAESLEDPSERLEQAYAFINDKLGFDILEKLYQIDPFLFEGLLLRLFEAMQYGKAELTRKTGDNGIDGIINEDELGVNKIFLQAKRYAANNKIGREAIQMFVGALSGKKVTKGVFITTSDFTQNAVEEAERSNIILINGKKLAELMIKHNIGVRYVKAYTLKTLDEVFFDDGFEI